MYIDLNKQAIDAIEATLADIRVDLALMKVACDRGIKYLSLSASMAPVVMDVHPAVHKIPEISHSGDEQGSKNHGNEFVEEFVPDVVSTVRGDSVLLSSIESTRKSPVLEGPYNNDLAMVMLKEPKVHIPNVATTLVDSSLSARIVLKGAGSVSISPSSLMSVVEQLFKLGIGLNLSGSALSDLNAVCTVLLVILNLLSAIIVGLAHSLLFRTASPGKEGSHIEMLMILRSCFYPGIVYLIAGDADKMLSVTEISTFTSFLVAFSSPRAITEVCYLGTYLGLRGHPSMVSGKSLCCRDVIHFASPSIMFCCQVELIELWGYSGRIMKLQNEFAYLVFYYPSNTKVQCLNIKDEALITTLMHCYRYNDRPAATICIGYLDPEILRQPKINVICVFSVNLLHFTSCLLQGRGAINVVIAECEIVFRFLSTVLVLITSFKWSIEIVHISCYVGTEVIVVGKQQHAWVGLPTKVLSIIWLARSHNGSQGLESEGLQGAIHHTSAQSMAKRHVLQFFSLQYGPSSTAQKLGDKQPRISSIFFFCCLLAHMVFVPSRLKLPKVCFCIVMEGSLYSSDQHHPDYRVVFLCCLVLDSKAYMFLLSMHFPETSCAPTLNELSSYNSGRMGSHIVAKSIAVKSRKPPLVIHKEQHANALSHKVATCSGYFSARYNIASYGRFHILVMVHRAMVIGLLYGCLIMIKFLLGEMRQQQKYGRQTNRIGSLVFGCILGHVSHEIDESVAQFLCVTNDYAVWLMNSVVYSVYTTNYSIIQGNKFHLHWVFNLFVDATLQFLILNALSSLHIPLSPRAVTIIERTQHTLRRHTIDCKQMVCPSGFLHILLSVLCVNNRKHLVGTIFSGLNMQTSNISAKIRIIFDPGVGGLDISHLTMEKSVSELLASSSYHACTTFSTSLSWAAILDCEEEVLNCQLVFLALVCDLTQTFQDSGIWEYILRKEANSWVFYCSPALPFSKRVQNISKFKVSSALFLDGQTPTITDVQLVYFCALCLWISTRLFTVVLWCIVWPIGHTMQALLVSWDVENQKTNTWWERKSIFKAYCLHYIPTVTAATDQLLASPSQTTQTPAYRSYKFMSRSAHDNFAGATPNLQELMTTPLRYTKCQHIASLFHHTPILFLHNYTLTCTCQNHYTTSPKDKHKKHLPQCHCPPSNSLTTMQQYCTQAPSYP